MKKKSAYKKTPSVPALEVSNPSPLSTEEEPSTNYSKKTPYCKLNITSNISLELFTTIFDVNSNNKIKLRLFKLVWLLVKRCCFKIIKFIFGN